MGVRIGRLGDSGLIARRIAPDRLVVCAAPEYLARHGVPQTPEDLASHNCLEYTYFESRGEWHLQDPTGAEIVVPESNCGDTVWLHTAQIAKTPAHVMPRSRSAC